MLAPGLQLQIPHEKRAPCTWKPLRVERRIQPGVNPQFQRPNSCQTISDQVEGFLEWVRLMGAQGQPPPWNNSWLWENQRVLRNKRLVTPLRYLRSSLQNQSRGEDPSIKNVQNWKISKFHGDLSRQSSPGKQMGWSTKTQTDNQLRRCKPWKCV